MGDLKKIGEFHANQMNAMMTSLHGEENKKAELMAETEMANKIDSNLKVMEEIAEADGAYEGVLDDDYEIAFERWCENYELEDLVKMLDDHLEKRDALAQMRHDYDNDK